MMKLILILLIGLLFESTGVILLKKGMTQIGDMQKVSASEVWRVVKSGITSPQILLGVLFEALFFGCLLLLMSKSDISFLWPMTGLSFVFATFAAICFLDERVSAVRWVGVVLIVFGAVLISVSEHAKPKLPEAAASTPVTPVR